MNRNEIERRRANAVARACGWGYAAAIEVSDDHTEGVNADASISRGYVEDRSGKPVPMSYVRKAFSHCHYRCAHCIVRLIDPRRDSPSGTSANAAFPS